MGYHYFIVRMPDGIDGPLLPIGETEWLDVVATDLDLRVNGRVVGWAVPEWSAPPPDRDAHHWRSPSDELEWRDGAVSARSPSDAWREKMNELAKRLNARVIGEGGEEYT